MIAEWSSSSLETTSSQGFEWSDEHFGFASSVNCAFHSAFELNIFSNQVRFLPLEAAAIGKTSVVSKEILSCLFWRETESARERNDRDRMHARGPGIKIDHTAETTDRHIAKPRSRRSLEQRSSFHLHHPTLASRRSIRRSIWMIGLFRLPWRIVRVQQGSWVFLRIIRGWDRGPSRFIVPLDRCGGLCDHSTSCRRLGHIRTTTTVRGRRRIRDGGRYTFISSV